MLLTSRRSLILGIGSLVVAPSLVVVAPSLVKATSLMPLRGYDMDPWVVGYFSPGRPNGAVSLYNLNILNMVGLNVKERVERLNRNDAHRNWFWKKARLSELTDNINFERIMTNHQDELGIITHR